MRMLRIGRSVLALLRTQGVIGLLAKVLDVTARSLSAVSSRGRLESAPALVNNQGAVLPRNPRSADAIPIPFASANDELPFDRVAVIAHIFYVDLTASILTDLKNIPVPVAVFISTDSEEKKMEIERILRSFENLRLIECVVRVVPNRGRDVAPKWIAFREVYDKYPAFLHLHSKKSLHSDSKYDGWRKYLFRDLVGTPEIATSNLRLLASSDVGLVYPDHYEKIRSDLNWGFDFQIARDLLSRVGVKLTTLHRLEFPSGSMFWGKSAAFRSLLGLSLQFEQFPDEAAQVDGTLAHAIERCIPYFVERSGFMWVKTRQSTAASESLSAAEIDQLTSSAFEPLLGSDAEPAEITLGAAPETYRILARPIRHEIPRLNLLVPTVNKREIYAGVDTALRVFLELGAQLPGVRLRIIATDAPLLDDVSERLQGFGRQVLGSEFSDDHTIVDATNRLHARLEITPADVFVATAWWTAHLAFKIIDVQKLWFDCGSPLLYLIQDYEPGFYGWSSRASLAEATYHHPDETIALINSAELHEYFAERYAFLHTHCLEFRMNERLAAALKPARREPIILYYARPSAARNCFEMGLEAIRLWQAANPVLEHFPI